MSLDFNDLWNKVQANRIAREGCKRHHFPRKEKYTIGMKQICSSCGGSLGLTEIGQYIQGYEAAGGNANDIIPGYREQKL